MPSICRENEHGFPLLDVFGDFQQGTMFISRGHKMTIWRKFGLSREKVCVAAISCIETKDASKHPQWTGQPRDKDSIGPDTNADTKMPCARD